MRAAALYTLIQTAKLNEIDPHAWLADFSHGCPIIQCNESTSSCPGTGKLRPTPPQPDSERLRRSDLTCGLHPMRTVLRASQRLIDLA